MDLPVDSTASPDVNALEQPKKSEAEIAALLEAEIDKAIASCGGDVRGALGATMTGTLTWKLKSNG
jgi:hypothetical protein